MVVNEPLARLLETAGGDVLVSADPALVRRLCGVTQEIETGPSPFAAGAVVLAPGDGPALLAISADEAPDADWAIPFAGFTLAPVDRAGALREAVREALGRLGHPRPVLLDAATVPVAAATLMDDAIPVPAEALARICAVKAPGDVAGIEAAIAVCDAGQAAARAAALPGVGELEVWQAARDAMERAAGARLPVLADVVTGPRTLEVGGPPGARVLAPGDAVLVDLVPRIDGLWGDSCATWVAGAPPDEAVREREAVLRAALAAALDALVPGATAGDVDAAARDVLAHAGLECPHHIGHGVGYAWHEEPRIVPHGPTVIEPGMVVALEPGAYANGVGMRLEQVALVEERGPRVLSRHALGAIPERGA
jgi:Xaa-Pro dipeptidase